MRKFYPWEVDADENLNELGTNEPCTKTGLIRPTANVEENARLEMRGNEYDVVTDPQDAR